MPQPSGDETSTLIITGNFDRNTTVQYAYVISAELNVVSSVSTIKGFNIIVTCPSIAPTCFYPPSSCAEKMISSINRWMGCYGYGCRRAPTEEGGGKIQHIDHIPGIAQLHNNDMFQLAVPPVASHWEVASHKRTLRNQYGQQWSTRHPPCVTFALWTWPSNDGE